ncbi:glycosyl hydrolase [Actinoplanes sp. NPDC051851]|uniref:glycosyl hydrolase n=1 Tax=Actinoplanes sp. NPDC051851 TaxID=3154753 RepID=UPI00341D82AC
MVRRIVTVLALVMAGLAVPRPALAANSGVLEYLGRISGTATLSGQYNRQPLATPSMWSQRAYDITGAWPAVWGQDFEFEASEVAARQTMVDEAISQWSAGSLVTLSWHVCPPTVAEPCDYYDDVRGDLTDAQWTEILTDGSALNTAWKARLDAIVPYLAQLRDAGVEVLFRPLHELNETAFWWSGHTGSPALYRITHDYLLAQGLTNLVWVWNVDDWAASTALAKYYPGADYVDVVTLDVYRNRFPTQEYYDAIRAIAGGKPIALGEVASVPAPADLAGQPLWTYWLPWAEYLVDAAYNTDDAIRATYADGRTVNRDEVAVPVNLSKGRPTYASSVDSTTRPATSATDASMTTRWSSAYTSDGWIYVDLGAVRSVRSVQLAWEVAYAKKYQIQTSTDQTTWTTVYQNDAGDGGTDAIAFTTPVGARYVKMYAWSRATVYGYSLWDMSVFG